METSILNRRESLILTAIDIVNELGIQGLSVREVAKRQEISNAAIFNHYKSKNDLIHAVLDHYSQYDLAVIQAIISRELKSIKAIMYYIDTFYTYYENYPAITAITQAFDELRCEPEFSQKVRGILISRNNYMKQMVEEAQAAGQIRSDIASDRLSDIIIGSCRYICLNWRMNGYDFPLKERILYTLDAILNSFTLK